METRSVDKVAEGALAPLMERPVKEGLYLALGPGALVPWSLDVFARVLDGSSSKVLWMDAGNGFDAFRLARASRALGRGPREALSRIELARPFNAYQLTAMLEEKLVPALKAASAGLAVLSDPLALFYDPEFEPADARKAWAPFLEALLRAASQVPILALGVQREPSPGRPDFLPGLLNRAKAIAQLAPEESPLPRSPGGWRLLPAYRRFSKPPDAGRWAAVPARVQRPGRAGLERWKLGWS